MLNEVLMQTLIKKYRYDIARLGYPNPDDIQLNDLHQWLINQFGIYVMPYYADDLWWYNITDMYGHYNPDNYTSHELYDCRLWEESYEAALIKGIASALNIIR